MSYVFFLYVQMRRAVANRLLVDVDRFRFEIGSTRNLYDVSRTRKSHFVQIKLMLMDTSFFLTDDFR